MRDENIVVLSDHFRIYTSSIRLLDALTIKANISTLADISSFIIHLLYIKMIEIAEIIRLIYDIRQEVIAYLTLIYFSLVIVLSLN